MTDTSYEEEHEDYRPRFLDSERLQEIDDEYVPFFTDHRGGTVKITKEDPPTPHGASAIYAEIAEKLQNDAGTWYRILDKDGHKQTAQNIKAAKLAAFRPAGSFEATSRRNGDKTFTVWARYVGEQ